MMITFVQHELVGKQPIGEEREMPLDACPNCFERPMLERDYVHTETGEEVTIQRCPKCNAMVEV